MPDTVSLVTTIGLEIHVELKTLTKMFCGCAVGFGGDPNTRVCPVCMGHPGTLPVANEKAIEYTMSIAMALGCDVAPRSIFHRKNYFYPDMPKNYQISQYDIPIGGVGKLEIEVAGKVHEVGITRVHLEEDTGKSLHVGGGGRIHESTYSLEDFNRAGTPLVEIVTEPDITSPEVARAFVTELRSIIEYLGVSDVRMEEGSMRVDANISVAPPGERGTKAEVKNMNSIRSVFRALEYEQRRQSDLLSQGGGLEQSTRHWDEKTGVTHAMRTKEFAFDYRYFPEPDLLPIEPSVEWLRQLREEIPELPAERRTRLVAEQGVTPDQAAVLTASRAIGEFFDEARVAANKAEPRQVANWIANDVSGLLAAGGEDFNTLKISPADLAKLVDLVAEGELSKAQGAKVLGEMVSTGTGPDPIIEREGMKQVSDPAAIEAAVDQAIKDNPEVADRIRAGEDKPFGFMVGQVMKHTKGQGNPGMINDLLRKRLR
ncbi:MAG TPA: Asp-tRNA(Asn)/Glu-tRNA(Gln) amidotransferase subunit GatB [Actinomycetota bacterium]|nr:Asp-tRNA(Asn)/Glu-tRNA(Gln) amidotransferase subunit GatB [Actinomycetota bacterium]